MRHDHKKRQACQATSKPTSTTDAKNPTTPPARPASRFGANVGTAIAFALVLCAAQEARAR